MTTTALPTLAIIDYTIWTILTLILVAVTFHQIWYHRQQAIHAAVRVAPISQIKTNMDTSKHGRIQHEERDISKKTQKSRNITRKQTVQGEMENIPQTNIPKHHNNGDGDGDGDDKVDVSITVPARISIHPATMYQHPTPTTTKANSSSHHTSLPLAMHQLLTWCTFLCVFRLTGAIPSCYGDDTLAMTLQIVGTVSSNTRTVLLMMSGARMAYVSMDVTFLALTQSPAPYSITRTYVGGMILFACSSVVSWALQIAWNKRWPASIFASMIGFALILIMTLFSVSVGIFTRQLTTSGLHMDTTSRHRFIERITRMQRVLAVGWVAVILSAAGASYVAYSASHDQNTPWRLDAYYLSYPDYCQIILCCWFRWYFWSTKE